MISKFDGRCFICGKPTKAGKDMYDLDTRQSYHAECKENQPPGPEAYALAERLGFE
jgi:hypothetical protein